MEEPQNQCQLERTDRAKKKWSEQVEQKIMNG
jgi:hypothetical protein